MPSSHRLIITGTPIQNHLAELWALYDLCCPGLLGDEVEFRREYSKKIAAGQSRDATQRQRSAGAMASEELRNKCKPFMLRREKSSVLAKAKEEETKEKKNVKEDDAPIGAAPKTDIGPSTSIEASTTGWPGSNTPRSSSAPRTTSSSGSPLRPAQERLYRAFLKSNTVRSVLNKTGSALSAINVLKKICDHPALCLAITETSGAAAAATSHAAATRTSPSSKSPHRMPTTAISTKKRRMGTSAKPGAPPSPPPSPTRASPSPTCAVPPTPPVSARSSCPCSGTSRRTVTGRSCSASRGPCSTFWNAPPTPTATRSFASTVRFPRTSGTRAWSDSSRTPPSSSALLTSQVGGLGLTLTAADRVVIYDPAWNPAADSQSVDRAYRIGQTRDVVVYRLVTCGTVEEKVYRRQVFKGGLSRAGTQDGNHFRYFSADETSQLFEVTESGMRSSRTQAELERLHAHQRRWTEELKDVEAPMLTRLGCAGVSDHDLLFSKEDSTKAGDGASVLSAGGGGGGGGKGGAGGKAAGGKEKPGKAARGGWKGVDAGWGGDARLAGLAIAAGSAVAAPPTSFAAPQTRN